MSSAYASGNASRPRPNASMRGPQLLGVPEIPCTSTRGTAASSPVSAGVVRAGAVDVGVATRAVAAGAAVEAAGEPCDPLVREPPHPASTSDVVAPTAAATT